MKPRDLSSLYVEAEALARLGVEKYQMKIDWSVYEKFKRDPYKAILFGGNLQSSLMLFGRDPGKDEVRWQEPLIGPAGTQVRNALHKRLFSSVPETFEKRRSMSERFVFANTVPYKPQGNKAWPEEIKSLFRPLMLELLVEHWAGNQILAFGTDAYNWYKVGQDDAVVQAMETLWESEARYENGVPITLKSPVSGQLKSVTVYPLPHPSPLNVRWFKQFPRLIEGRLQGMDLQ